MTDLTGRTLGQYDLRELIGAGGMGRVYRARDVSLDRTVALKVIRDDEVADPAQRERFIREARAQARLRPKRLQTRFWSQLGVEPLATDQLDQDARVEVAAAGAHHQPCQGREAHGGVDAAAARDGRHTRMTGTVLAENRRMLKFVKSLGFESEPSADDPQLVEVSLEL